MEDFLGTEINVGDMVVHASSTSGGLSKGKIVKITAKQVTVDSHWTEPLDGRMFWQKPKSVPPSNVVVLSSERLKDEFKETLAKVVEAIKDQE